MVLDLVASCDCFVIIMVPRKEKFEFGYDLLRHSAFCIVHEIVIEASKKLKSSNFTIEAETKVKLKPCSI